MEALRLEAGFRSVKIMIEINCLRSYEKALRMDEDHPRYLAATDPTWYRLESIITFRKKAEKLLDDHPHLNKCRRALLSSPYLDRIRDQINTVNSHLTIQ